MTKLPLKWTRIGLTDLEKAFDFLVGQDKPIMAKKIIQKVLEGIEQVRLFPDLGRNGRVTATRELIIPTTPFIVVYRHKNKAIEILTILHHSRKWED